MRTDDVDASSEFLNSLNSLERAEWNGIRNKDHGGDKRWFDLRELQRFVVERAFAFGWTPENFAAFDREVGTGSRNDHDRERIGKKYQWIAYHEALARISDNFQFIDPNNDSCPQVYQHAWQVNGLRDIDPSVLVRRTGAERNITAPCWWAPYEVPQWRQIDDDEAWLRTDVDMPDPRTLLAIPERSAGQKWMTLFSHMHWEEPMPPGFESGELPRREIWLEVQAYIVAAEHFDEIWTWLQTQDFWGRWMPQQADLREIFQGEDRWSNGNSADCTSEGEELHHEMPHPMRPATATYNGVDSSYDRSMDQAIRFHQPSPWLIGRMNLEWALKEAKFRYQGHVVAFDPSVEERGPSAALIDKDCFLSWLEANSCRVVWTVMGEKWILSERFQSQHGGRLRTNGCMTIRDGIIDASIKSIFEAFPG